MVTIWEFWESWKFWVSLVILGKSTGNKHRICKCFLGKAKFLPLLNISLEWFTFIIIRNVVNSMILEQMTQHIFFFIFLENLIIFFGKTHLCNFGHFFLECIYECMRFLGMHIWYRFERFFLLENAFMNAWFFIFFWNV